MGIMNRVRQPSSEFSGYLRRLRLAVDEFGERSALHQFLRKEDATVAGADRVNLDDVRVR